MIEEQFVSFETAKLLKEAGFDVPCNSYYELEDGEAVRKDCIRPYDNNGFGDTICSRPTLALAARWLQEVHDTFVKMERVGNTSLVKWMIWYGKAILSHPTASIPPTKKPLKLACRKRLNL